MKRFASMLITRLSQHQMILEKTWMNKIEMIIDMRDDRLQFSSFETHIKASIKAHLISLSIIKKIVIEQKSSTSTQILKRFISSVVIRLSEKSSSFSKIVKSFNSVNFASSFDSMNIAMIEAAAYKSLVKWSNVTTFAIIITKIDRLLKTARNKSEDVNLQELSHEKILKEVKAKLSSKYYDYLDVFNRAMTDQLSSHRFYDHKIKLIDEKTSSWSRLYHMSDYKLQKMKNYLIEHLNKHFIFFSSISYASLILFIEKKDDSLRFCVYYRKLNALIKRNRYSLLLIDETLARIQDSKYDSIEYNSRLQQTTHAFKKRRFDYLYYLFWLLQILRDVFWINQRFNFLSTLYERRAVWLSTSVLSDLSRWHYHLQQNTEET